MLDRACDGSGALPSSCDMLQWVVGSQQQQRKLFIWKAEVATYCSQLANAGRRYMCKRQKERRAQQHDILQLMI